LDNPLLTVGVIADTHIPDRARALHPHIIPLLQELRVDLILHAGDISSPGVLELLATVAPVKAVRGNRDWVFLTTLPLILKLTLANVPLVLMHGHNGMANYLRDKFFFIRDGYNFERYQKKLVKLVPEARVIVFGHTHRVENVVINGQLWFNPGSAGFSSRRGTLPSIGVLRFYDKGEVRGEVFKLDGFQLQKGFWEACGSS
jgi:putative phosphoesterase